MIMKSPNTRAMRPTERKIRATRLPAGTLAYPIRATSPMRMETAAAPQRETIPTYSRRMTSRMIRSRMTRNQKRMKKSRIRRMSRRRKAAEPPLTVRLIRPPILDHPHDDPDDEQDDAD